MRTLAALIVTCLVAATVATAQPHAISQQGRLDSKGLPLRWDNVEGRPTYVGGPPLVWAGSLGMRVCYLPAETTLTVKLPPNTLLRVVRPNGVLHPEDLEVARSEGSGLLVDLKPIVSTDRRSLFLFPDSVGTSLIHIRPRGKPNR